MDDPPSEPASAPPDAPAEGAAEAPSPARILPVLLLFVFLSVMTGTMINVALPSIGRHFDVGEPTYGWIVSGYMLTFGVFSAVHGRLADLFGTRRLYLFGCVAFALGAVAAAAAPTIEVLIGLRILTGVGSAAIPALGATIVARLLPAGQRSAATGWILGTVGVGASISPFIGGLVLEWTSWRVVFLVPGISVLALPWAWWALPRSLDEVPGDTRFDVLGAGLLGLGAAGLLYATDLVESHGFDGVTLGVAATSVALLVAFALWIRHHDEPFAPPWLFREWRWVSAVAVATLGNAARFGTIVLIPIFLENVVGASPFTIGATLAPGAVVLAILSPLAGRLADRIGARWVAAPSAVLLFVACLASVWLFEAGTWGATLAMTLFGAAFAGVQSPLLGSLGDFLPQRDLGIANGMYMMIFFLGGGLGVAVAVTLVAAQPDVTASWLGLGETEAARFGNTALALGLIALLPLPLIPLLPRKRADADETPDASEPAAA
jgi:MFS transporter, DHA2 family, metal-tetracycline-proton antiporter